MEINNISGRPRTNSEEKNGATVSIVHVVRNTTGPKIGKIKVKESRITPKRDRGINLVKRTLCDISHAKTIPIKNVPKMPARGQKEICQAVSTPALKWRSQLQHFFICAANRQAHANPTRAILSTMLGNIPDMA
jgi:hypothetical protein